MECQMSKMGEVDKMGEMVGEIYYVWDGKCGQDGGWRVCKMVVEMDNMVGKMDEMGKEEALGVLTQTNTCNTFADIYCFALCLRHFGNDYIAVSLVSRWNVALQLPVHMRWD